MPSLDYTTTLLRKWRQEIERPWVSRDQDKNEVFRAPDQLTKNKVVPDFLVLCRGILKRPLVLPILGNLSFVVLPNHTGPIAQLIYSLF
jgi:hypothetical protein